MNHSHLKQHRVLAVAPSTRGFGFAVLEGQQTLVDWGVKSVTEDKNRASVAKVKELIHFYRPGMLVFPDSARKHSRRSARIQALTRELKKLAITCRIPVASLSREQVKLAFFDDVQGTKHALAEMVAHLFPQELGVRLPPKRRPWMSEDYRLDIFEAVALALALAFRLKARERRQRLHSNSGR